MASLSALPPILLGLAVPGVLLFVWWLAVVRGWATPLTLPAPGSVVRALLDMCHDGTLSANLATSLRRAAIGFALGAVAGLGLGATMGLSRTAELLLRPGLMAIVQVPVLAWIPLLMIPCGIGETLKYVTIGVAAFSPILVNTAKGFRQVSPALVEVGALYRFTTIQRLRHILIPGALPPLFTGLRLGMTQGWHSLVVVELVASTEGIGYLAVMARQMFQLDVMLATMAVIGIVGFSLDRTLRAAEAWCARRFGGQLA